MKAYTITVQDDFFRHHLTGNFTARSKASAIKQAKEFYAQELDTIPKAITIIEVKEVT